MGDTDEEPTATEHGGALTAADEPEEGRRKLTASEYGKLGGRPRDPFGPEKKRLFLAAFADSGDLRTARQASGIADTTLFRWFAEDPEFRAGYDTCRRDLEGHLVGRLYHRAVSDEVDTRAANVAAIVWGKRNFPADWLERRQEQSLTVNVSVQADAVIARVLQLRQAEQPAIDGEVLPSMLGAEQ